MLRVRSSMAARPTIRLTVPGTLAYRGVAVRVVAEACRLISAPSFEAGTPIDFSAPYDLRHPFDAEFVSAFAEIFNNIAIHAYQRRGGGDVDVTIFVGGGDDPSGRRGLVVEIRDQGRAFDIGAVASPDLDALPEAGMGIHIARALLDQVEYEPGPPNLWRLVKRLRATASISNETTAT
jgi:serine/threonine-protein kinase RsbW